MDKGNINIEVHTKIGLVFYLILSDKIVVANLEDITFNTSAYEVFNETEFELLGSL